ncbi:hypothetical protein V8B97DRAFT_1735919 [Scleroderma yunnanense]
MKKSELCALCRLISSLICRRWRLDDHPKSQSQETMPSLKPSTRYNSPLGQHITSSYWVRTLAKFREQKIYTVVRTGGYHCNKKPPPHCRHVALSYVGVEQETITGQRLRISHNVNRPAGIDGSILPATILDAIHLVQQIGEWYLCIDALCII